MMQEIVSGMTSSSNDSLFVGHVPWGSLQALDLAH